MPELPEVETVVRSINQSLKSNYIKTLNIFNDKLRWKIDPYTKTIASKAQINNIYRRGKHIIFHLDKGFLIIHLGMTGIIRYSETKSYFSKEKHDHYEIILKDNSKLIYNDVRKFGSLHWTDDIDKHFLIENLGVEPLSNDFTYDYLKNIAKKRDVAIKNLIMNQNIVVGVGNIYASEALYMSGIRPNRKSKYVTINDCKKLVQSIKKVLLKSIKSGGTTLKDFASTDGKLGYFKQKLLIYNKDVTRCGQKVKVVKIGGRSSFFCPKCQK